MTDTPVRPKIRSRGLRSIVSAACAAVLLTGAATAVLPGTAHAAITSNQSGIQGGYYYSLWTDTAGTVGMDLGPGGNYRVRWQNAGNFFAGKGWNPGGRRTVNYSASFNPIGSAFMGLYGWTKNPLVEYYIVDNWTAWRPPGEVGFRGTVVTDGGVYDIYRTYRGAGFNLYAQFWSVRQTKRTGGTITVGNHFDAWAQLGMNLGTTHDFQIMAVEGYQSSGTAEVTVLGPPPYPATPPATTVAP